MVHTNKILTVSYGTFSCTLEGFDDSFGTMKAIAEYFRDLAADDRYFGAEPPQPDADMLARIAQREIARRVEAHEDSGKIVLRAAEDTQQSAVAAPATVAAPAPEVAAPAPQPEATPAQVTESTTAPEPTEVEVADVAAEDAAVDEEDGVDTAALADVLAADPIETPHFVAEDVTPGAEPPTVPAVDSIAARLQRIRAVVSRNEAQVEDVEYVEDEHADVVPTTSESLSEAIASSASDDMLEEDEPADAVPDLAAFLEDQAVESEAAGDTDTEGVAFEDDQGNNVQEAAPETDGGDAWESEDVQPDADEMEDMPAEADTVEAHTVTLEDHDNAPETIALDAADDGDDQPEMAQDGSDAHDADEDVLILTRDQSVDDNADAAAEMDQVDEDALDQAEAEIADLIAEADVDLGDTSIAAVPDDDEPLEAGDHLFEDMIADDGETLDDDEQEDTALVRVVKVKRADLEAAIEAGELEEVEDTDTPDQETLSEEDEQELLRNLANVETDEEDAPGKSVKRETALSEDAGDADISRLMEEAGSKLDEASSHRDEYDHLRAAVAATKAEHEAGGVMEEVKDNGAYRADLASVVRPRRPEAMNSDRNRRPAEARPAPLKLVAEQRVDSAATHGPVRPRRVGADLMADGGDTDLGNGFAKFATDAGARELPQLLEAAAAYLSYVEGRERFSRPQLMTKVRMVEQESFNREDGLRYFGQLLREGKIEKAGSGRFTVSEAINYKPSHRQAV